MELEPKNPLQNISAIFGHEVGLDEVTRRLKADVRKYRPDVVGALHLTCSDEAEKECALAFQKNFSQQLLPRLKHSLGAAFRSAFNFARAR